MTTIEYSTRLLSFESSLLKFAYHLNLRRPDAKDLVQETFLKALLKKDKYLDNGKFRSWIFTIMKNAFVDRYRRNVNQNTHLDLSQESFLSNQIEPIGYDNPASAYSALEINQNIDLLNDKLRIPFKMYISGFKYSEIADTLNIKIGTVKNRIFLSRQQLMSLLTS